MSEAEEKTMKYDAFISYRHSPKDTEVAQSLQMKLETFKIPAEIQKMTGKKKIGRIFRDREELPLTSDLTETITQALGESEYLILICSPEMKESEWVQREVETFLKSHDQSKVLTVLTGGEPVDVIPDVLKEKKIIDEKTGEITVVPVEPLSCEYRFGSIAKCHKTELPRLVSGIIGCRYDDLMQRQKQRRLRTIRTTAFSILSVVTLLAVLFTGYALDKANRIAEQAEEISKQKDEIETQQVEIEKNLARTTAEQAISLLEKGDRKSALESAVFVQNPLEGNRIPMAGEQYEALTRALNAYSFQPNVFSPYRTITCSSRLSMDGCATEDGKMYLNCDAIGYLYGVDLETGEVSWKERIDDLVGLEGTKCTEICLLNGDKVVLFGKEFAAIVDAKTGQLCCDVIKLEHVDEEYKYCCSAISNGRIAIATGYGTSFSIAVYDENGTRTGVFEGAAGGFGFSDDSGLKGNPVYMEFSDHFLTVGLNGSRIVDVEHTLCAIDLDSGEVRTLDKGKSVSLMLDLGDDRVAVYTHFVDPNDEEAQYFMNYTNYSGNRWELAAYDLQTGEALWSENETEGAAQILSLMRVTGLQTEQDGPERDVILRVRDNEVKALGVEDGQAYSTVWSEGYIYRLFDSDGSLYALHRNGMITQLFMNVATLNEALRDDMEGVLEYGFADECVGGPTFIGIRNNVMYIHCPIEDTSYRMLEGVDDYFNMRKAYRTVYDKNGSMQGYRILGNHLPGGGFVVMKVEETSSYYRYSCGEQESLMFDPEIRMEEEGPILYVPTKAENESRIVRVNMESGEKKTFTLTEGSAELCRVVIAKGKVYGVWLMGAQTEEPTLHVKELESGEGYDISIDLTGRPSEEAITWKTISSSANSSVIMLSLESDGEGGTVTFDLEKECQLELGGKPYWHAGKAKTANHFRGLVGKAGKYAVILSEEEGMIDLYDLDNLQRTGLAEIADRTGMDLDFIDEDRYLILKSDYLISLFDCEDGKVVSTIENPADNMGTVITDSDPDFFAIQHDITSLNGFVGTSPTAYVFYLDENKQIYLYAEIPRGTVSLENREIYCDRRGAGVYHMMSYQELLDRAEEELKQMN